MTALPSQTCEISATLNSSKGREFLPIWLFPGVSGKRRSSRSVSAAGTRRSPGRDGCLRRLGDDASFHNDQPLAWLQVLPLAWPLPYPAALFAIKSVIKNKGGQGRLAEQLTKMAADRRFVSELA